MTVATFTQTNYTTQSSAAYKTNIDADIQVLARIGDMFAPRQTTTPAMTISVDAGALLVNGALVTQAAQTSGTITAPSSHPRIDRAVINATTGALSIVTGAEAGSPSPPAITAGCLPCAQIALAVGQSSIVNANITDERVLATPLSSPGEGHITIWPNAYSGITQGTWAWSSVGGGQLMSAAWENTSHANADRVDYTAYLAAGTYTFNVLGVTHNDSGILDLLFNGTSQGTVDFYSAGDVVNVTKTITGIVVPASGIYTISLKLNGKNGSSGGYRIDITTMTLYRTA